MKERTKAKALDFRNVAKQKSQWKGIGRKEKKRKVAKTGVQQALLRRSVDAYVSHSHLKTFYMTEADLCPGKKFLVLLKVCS